MFIRIILYIIQCLLSTQFHIFSSQIHAKYVVLCGICLEVLTKATFLPEYPVFRHYCALRTENVPDLRSVCDKYLTIRPCCAIIVTYSDLFFAAMRQEVVL